MGIIQDVEISFTPEKMDIMDTFYKVKRALLDWGFCFRLDISASYLYPKSHNQVY